MLHHIFRNLIEKLSVLRSRIEESFDLENRIKNNANYLEERDFDENGENGDQLENKLKVVHMANTSASYLLREDAAVQEQNVRDIKILVRTIMVGMKGCCQAIQNVDMKAKLILSHSISTSISTSLLQPSADKVLLFNLLQMDVIRDHVSSLAKLFRYSIECGGYYLTERSDRFQNPSDRNSDVLMNNNNDGNYKDKHLNNNFYENQGSGSVIDKEDIIFINNKRRNIEKVEPHGDNMNKAEILDYILSIATPLSLLETKTLSQVLQILLHHFIGKNIKAPKENYFFTSMIELLLITFSPAIHFVTLQVILNAMTLRIDNFGYDIKWAGCDNDNNNNNINNHDDDNDNDNNYNDIHTKNIQNDTTKNNKNNRSNYSDKEFEISTNCPFETKSALCTVFTYALQSLQRFPENESVLSLKLFSMTTDLLRIANLLSLKELNNSNCLHFLLLIFKSLQVKQNLSSSLLSFQPLFSIVLTSLEKILNRINPKDTGLQYQILDLIISLPLDKVSLQKNLLSILIHILLSLKLRGENVNVNKLIHNGFIMFEKCIDILPFNILNLELENNSIIAEGLFFEISKHLQPKPYILSEITFRILGKIGSCSSFFKASKNLSSCYENDFNNDNNNNNNNNNNNSNNNINNNDINNYNYNNKQSNAYIKDIHASIDSKIGRAHV